MAELTQEVFDSLPDAVKEDYEQQGEVFVSRDSLKLSALKGNLDKAYGERDEYKGKVLSIEQTKAQEIAEAKEQALAEALEKNNTEKATRLFQEKIADAERRAGETENKFKERLEGIAKQQKSAIVKTIAALGTKSTSAALARIVDGMVKIDPETGAETYLNNDGSASSLNQEQFIASLKDNDLFKPLLAAAQPTTTGDLRSSLDVSGRSEQKKKLSTKTSGYLATIK